MRRTSCAFEGDRQLCTAGVLVILEPTYLDLVTAKSTWWLKTAIAGAGYNILLGQTRTQRERDRVRTCRYPIAIHSHSAATGWLEKHRKQNMDNIRPIKHTNTSSDNIQMTGVVFCKCPTCEWFNVIELTLAWAQRDSMLAQYYVTTQPRYSFTQATFLTDMT